jgi:hypothetical protein
MMHAWIRWPALDRNLNMKCVPIYIIYIATVLSFTIAYPEKLEPQADWIMKSEHTGRPTCWNNDVLARL